MFTRIIVPLDGTGLAEAALAPAQRLAQAFHAQVLVVTAVPSTPLPLAASSWDMQQQVKERLDEADAYLHEIVDGLRAQSCHAELLVHIGQTATGIVQAAASHCADAIVMAPHAHWRGGSPGGPAPTLKVLARTRIPLRVWRRATAQDPASEVDAGRCHTFPSLLPYPDCPIVVPLDGSPCAEHALEA